jgi:drug/metabolite transporter (DMT)-like permease
MPSHRPRPESFDATLGNLTEPVIAVDCSAVPVAIRAGTLWAVPVSAFIGWIVWGWVDAVRGVARAAPLNCLMPPVAGLVAWLAMGESCTWIKLAGAAVTLAGVALAQFGRRG